MPEFFIDTAYLVPLLRTRDSLHQQAVELSNELARRPIGFVTSHAVFSETLGLVARSSAELRADAAAMVRALSRDRSCDVVEFNKPLFDRSLEFYEARGDKTYSLVDCSSMLICRDRGVTDVLTSDHDFVQEGFKALLAPLS